MRRTRRGLFRMLERKADRRAAMKRTDPAAELKRLMRRQREPGRLLGERGLAAVRASRVVRRAGAVNVERETTDGQGQQLAPADAQERWERAQVWAQGQGYGSDPIADVLNKIGLSVEVDSDIDAAFDVIDRLFDGDLGDEDVEELLAELDRLGL